MSRAHFTYVRTHSPTLPSLYLLYVTAHSPVLALLHLRHSSFSNPPFTSSTSQALPLIHLVSRPWYPVVPTSQLILQPLRCFTYVTVHSPILLSLLLLTSSSLNSPGEPLIIPGGTYVTAHSPTLALLHIRHTSFSNPSFASPTSQALHLIHLVSRNRQCC